MARLNLSKFKQAVGKVKSAAEKREETKMHITRMAELQQYVDNSEEKINLLFDTLHTKAQDCDKTILEKGVVAFVYYVDILQTIKERLEDAGIKITPERLKISDRAVICMPYHVMQDCLEENRLAGKQYGSTRRGIAPASGDTYILIYIRIPLECSTISRKTKYFLIIFLYY